ncbi:MAG: Lrp/AsnC family transcriptional regulator [Desulfurococcaceae archaeon]|jgi:DNA-binding Lrp family transcriptional regulator|nr:Lrp/AsnC family transcriptional regulator [Desulfurococcaceae archaeon]
MCSDLYSQKVDSLDLEILRALSKNSKLSIREISKIVKKSPSLIHSRIRRLEKSGFIRNYTILVDYQKLGYDVYALTLLQVDGAHIVEVEEALSKEPNIKAVYDITGEYDVAFISAFKSVSELDNFIKKLLKNPYIKRSVTSIILRVVKDTPHIEAAYTSF